MLRKVQQLLQQKINKIVTIGQTAGESQYLKEQRQEGELFSQDVELYPAKPSVPQIGNVVQLAGSIASFYDPVVYSYCIFDLPTILSTVKIIDEDELLAKPNSLLMPPHTLINQRRRGLSDTIGVERSKHLERVLEVIWTAHENSSLSLSRECTRQGVNNEQLVNFLRGLTLCSAISHPFMHQVVYVFNELLNYGEIGEELTLSGDSEDRAIVLSRLCLCAAKEFGNYSMLTLALTLLNRGAVNIDYKTCKQMSICFHRIEHRLLDWRMKTCGKLTKKAFKSKG